MLWISISGFGMQQDSIKVREIEGTIRAKYEYKTLSNTQRFQIRNARFGFSGLLNKITFYKAEIDLSDEGVTKMLDAYIRLKLINNLSLTMGQHKIPFSSDNLRSPHLLYFANRSFIGKQLTALRDVGMNVKYQYDRYLPFEFNLAIYNGTGLYNQKIWHKINELTYVTRLVMKPIKEISLSLNYQNMYPFQNRINMYDAGLQLQIGNFHIESEIFRKVYDKDYDDNTDGMFVFMNYDFKTPHSKIFTKITPLFRYDSMTKNLKYSDSGDISFDPANKRLTLGLTLSLDKAFCNDIRLNYEYYYPKDGISNDESKIVLEMVSHF